MKQCVPDRQNRQSGDHPDMIATFSSATDTDLKAAVGAISEADLLAYCKEKLSDFKRPKQIHITETIPRTATGKIQRRVVAQAFAGQTRFSSLELGTSHNTENPNAESGYSTVIKDNLNWSNASTPLPRETEPLRAFNRLFSDLPMNPGMGGTPAPLAYKDAVKRSLLDYTLGRGDALGKRLSTLDRAKLGFAVVVFLGVRLAAKGRLDLEAFERAVQAIPEVQVVQHVLGIYDYRLKVVARDLSDFERILRRRIMTLPGVGVVESNVMLSQEKAAGPPL